jgi:drug/metabolite transporter (DMT)-like permease
MAPYSFALISAIIWAVSTLIVNQALRVIPGDQKPAAITLGVCAALAGGLLVQLPFADFATLRPHFSPTLALGGILLFPIGTGLYYLSGYTFGEKTQFAAQFAKVKPLLTVLLGLVLLGERLPFASIIALALITAGLAVMIGGAVRGEIKVGGLVFGMLTAVAWAFGEFFVKVGGGDSTMSQTTLVSLSAALAFSAPFALFAIATRWSRQLLPALGWFFLHGIVSFGIAYACFFESLKQIGLSHTVMVTSFWPILAMGIGTLVRSDDTEGLPRPILVGALILLAGSITQTGYLILNSGGE